MKPETQVVHVGDRKKPGTYTPVAVPIFAAASYTYDTMAELDRVFAGEQTGPSYARHDNPTTLAFEELVNTLEGGGGAIGCASGMSALHLAILAAMMDRRRHVLAASAIYGATINLLNSVLDPLGIPSSLVDITDLAAIEAACERDKPGAIVMETISNPLLRVGAIDEIAKIARRHGAALIVDNTFATPLLVRPLGLGAHFSVHSATKYLSGHGDVLAGVVISTAEEYPQMKAISKTIGAIIGPFEAYLAMRGVKTLALRVERQCANAVRVAEWLAKHPRIDRVYSTYDPTHPDAATIARMFPKGQHGAMLSFELKGAKQPEVFEFMDRLKMIVRATSLGDVHTMTLYPAMSSHRDVAPKQRERLGIKDNLIRVSVGIEAVDDIVADLEQALA